MPNMNSFFDDSASRKFFAFAAIVTVVRILALFFSDINLGPDETQYWFWSQIPAFGYFSKPPMIAWAIAATTGVFGDSEWAVRLSAPFFHLATTTFVFLTARRLYDERSAFWAGLVWLTLPAATLSSMVISTDALLLCFWSAALYFFFKVASPDTYDGKKALTAMSLGAAIGLGFLSKYAMIYFMIGAAMAIAVTYTRLTLRHTAIAAATALIIMAPNLLWNADHGFQTVTHTAANADWRGDLFHPLALLEFVVAQFGVFGPVTFGLLIAGLITIKPRLTAIAERRWTDLALISFTLPPLIIVSVQAFISRAHANWAAAAYPAAAILITAWAIRADKTKILKAGIGINLIASVIFLIAATNFSVADGLGLSEIVKRVRGWEEQGADIARISSDFDAVMVDDREVMGGILYYGRTSKTPVVAWNSNIRIDHHYEAFHAFRPARFKRLLYVTPHSDAIAVRNQFDTIRRLGETTADLKDGRYRRLYLFELDGYRYLRGDLMDEEDPL